MLLYALFPPPPPLPHKKFDGKFYYYLQFSLVFIVVDAFFFKPLNVYEFYLLLKLFKYFISFLYRTLADLDKDGRMTVQEFSIAVQLIEAKLKGVEIPKILPASLKSSTDPSYHGFSESNMQMPLQPMQSSFVMNGGPGTTVQPSPSNAMYGLPPNMGMQMPPNMGMQNIRMNYSSVFSSQTVTVNRVVPGPQNFNVFNGPQPIQTKQTASLGRHPSFQSESLISPAHPPAYNYSQTLPVNNKAFDSLALDKLTDLSNLNKAGNTVVAIGDISAPIRLKYTQLFKVADNEKIGLLTGMCLFSFSSLFF